MIPNLGDPGFRTPRVFRRPELTRGEWQVWRWSEGAGFNYVTFTRLTILRTPWFRIMLHRYEQPEHGTILHNHWSWLLAFVLWGRYTEERQGRDRRRLRVVRWINWVPQRVFHRVAEVKRGTITLCITGPNKHPVKWID